MKRALSAAGILACYLAMMAACSVYTPQTSPGTLPALPATASGQDGTPQAGSPPAGIASDSATADPIAFTGRFAPANPASGSEPVLGLDNDGSFQLTVNLPNGTGSLFGTYTLDENSIYLNVSSHDLPSGQTQTGAGRIVLSVLDGDTLVWEGTHLGDALPGDIFSRF